MNERLLILLMVLLSAGSSAFAQRQSSVEAGMKVSGSAAHLYSNPVLKRLGEHSIRYGYGFFIQYNSRSPFSVRIEPGLEQKGGSVVRRRLSSDGSRVESDKLEIYQYYYTLPVLCRATIGEKIKYFVNAGPFVAYNQDYYSFDNTCGTTDVEEYAAYNKRFDAGITVGAGVSVPVHNLMSVSLEARNNLGLYNINQVTDIKDSDIRTNTAGLILAVAYRLSAGK